MSIRILLITDHRNHSDSNSLYPLGRALKVDLRCEEVWVITRSDIENQDFYDGLGDGSFNAVKINDEFLFHPDGIAFRRHVQTITANDIDVIVFRMPQPVDSAFLQVMEKWFVGKQMINSPSGMLETGNKAFLLQIESLCPSPQLCLTKHEAIERSRREEIVLKPLYSYGGKGMLRLSKDSVWKENECFSILALDEIISESMFPMVSMRFLKNVIQGDKRTLVVNQTILGSANRIPADGHWVCNVAQGGHAINAVPDEEELVMEAILTPLLFAKGIVMYGFDTLVDDNGKRVLSEINTASIGGIGPMEELSGRPVVRLAAKGIMDFVCR